MLWDNAAISCDYDTAGGIVVKARFVAAGIAQGIILIGQIHDASFDRDLFAGEPVWIAASVKTLVMAEGNLVRRPHPRVSTDDF